MLCTVLLQVVSDKAVGVQADRSAQELPGLVAPISRNLTAAVERLAHLERTALKPEDAVLASNLAGILAK